MSKSLTIADTSNVDQGQKDPTVVIAIFGSILLIIFMLAALFGRMLMMIKFDSHYKK